VTAFAPRRLLFGIHSSQWPDGEYTYRQKGKVSSFIFPWHNTYKYDGVAWLRSFCWRCRNNFLPLPFDHTGPRLAVNYLYTINATRAMFLLLAVWQVVNSEMWRDQDQITALLRHARRKQTIPIIHVFERFADLRCHSGASTKLLGPIRNSLTAKYALKEVAVPVSWSRVQRVWGCFTGHVSVCRNGRITTIPGSWHRNIYQRL
jgi:hypothetical protein